MAVEVDLTQSYCGWNEDPGMSETANVRRPSPTERIVGFLDNLDPDDPRCEAEGLAIAKALKDDKQFEPLAEFAERMRGAFPRQLLFRTLQAQALVDLGLVQAAGDVLAAGVEEAVEGSQAWSELFGLIGRTHKQVYVDNRKAAPALAKASLELALKAYGKVYDLIGAYWHGGNIAALLFQQPERAAELDAFALQFTARIDEVPVADRDAWWWASKAEARLGAGDFAGFLECLAGFGAARPDAFAFNSFQRQLSELWGLDRGCFGPEGEAALATLRAAALKAEGGVVEVRADAVVSGGRPQSATAGPRSPRLSDLEKVFGFDGPMEMSWVQLGLYRARSVAGLLGPSSSGSFKRKGTGFVVAVKDGAGATRLCLLTNAHVIGDQPDAAIPSIEKCRVQFEALGPTLHRVKAQLWTSPWGALDATLLELETLPEGIEPIPLSAELASLDETTRLYIIGHPRGGALSFSMQDNLFLSRGARPPPDGPVFLHYRTPTEGGNSGSPVFIAEGWTVVALHHAGATDMERLDGSGVHAANEGISLGAIAAALKTQGALDLGL